MPPRMRTPRSRGATYLLHWSEVPDRSTSLDEIAPMVRDLVDWAADIARVLSRHCPEDQAAIERVRRYVLDALDGKPQHDVDVEDILTSAAALMSAIDLHVGGTVDTDRDIARLRIRRMA